MLFDTHDDPVDGKKRRKANRQPTAVDSGASESLPAFRPPVTLLKPLGQIDDVYECADDRCRAGLHDILDEYGGSWRIECVFCGTGQRVKAIRGYFKQEIKKAYVFAAGDYAGMAISDVAADPRGMGYIEWAAGEHTNPTVKAACKSFLDSHPAAR